MKYVATFIVLFGTWILLAGFNLNELIVGALTSLVLSVVIAKNINYKVDIKLPFKLIVFLVVYIPVFVYHLILANFDIARRVLSFKIPLHPGIVKVKTGLTGDIAKLTLANSITLTPGTLTIDVVDEDLYIHCVDVKGKNEAENRQNISTSFEKILGVIFK